MPVLVVDEVIARDAAQTQAEAGPSAVARLFAESRQAISAAERVREAERREQERSVADR
eukprot:gene27499-62209_t